MKYINKIVVSNQEPPINTLWIEGDSLKYYNNGWKEVGGSQEEIQKHTTQITTLQKVVDRNYIELATKVSKIEPLESSLKTLQQGQVRLWSSIDTLRDQVLRPSKLQVADPENLTLTDLNLIMGDLKARGIINISTKS